MFDLTADRTSQVTWSVDLPLGQRPWHIGLVVGPSGCGKSTIARHLWPDAVTPPTNSPGSKSLPPRRFPAGLSSRTSPPIVLRRFLVAAGMAAAVPGIVPPARSIADVSLDLLARCERHATLRCRVQRIRWCASSDLAADAEE